MPDVDMKSVEARARATTFHHAGAAGCFGSRLDMELPA
jgi:hypothetical protein